MSVKNCDFKTFFNKIGNKKIVLFGAGKILSKMEVIFSSLGRNAENIIYIMDNDKMKWGLQRNFCKKLFIIDSVEHVLSQIDKNCVIVITNYEYSLSMIKQLKEYSVFDKYDIDCYIYPLMEEQQDIVAGQEQKYIFRLTNKIRIPKTIHYFWFGDKEIPKEQQEYMSTWKKFCPDYEIVQWNEKNYDINKQPYMKQAYQSGRMGFVPDYARLDIIYQYGGIYLDTDVELIRSLDDLLYQEAYCGMQMGGSVNLGSGFGAVAEMPVIKAMRDDYNTATFLRKDGSYNLASSPVYQTATLRKYGFIQNGRCQVVDNMTIYPVDVLCGVGSLSGRFVQTQNTVSLHHPSLSWADKEKIDQLRMTIAYFNEQFDNKRNVGKSLDAK